MILVDLRQGSPAWLRWRLGGLGGSDAAAILGVSPYKSARRLWQERTGAVAREEQTFAMRRGIRLEPVARRLYQEQSGHDLRPACCQHDHHAWLRASLDGLDLWGERLCEIKCPNVDSHRAALNGDIPEDHLVQIQHQLAVTGAAVCDYVSYSEHRIFGGDEQLAVIEVRPDAARIREMLFAEWCFWGSIQFGYWPEAKKAADSRGVATLGQAI
jgi:putative phage-type endonuclease